MTRERVDRRLLQQALQQGQQISQQAASGRGFDPRGGVGVLAAQLATAGIGAFAQNRARKKLAEQEKISQEAFATQFPQFAGLSGQLTPETRQAVIAKQLSGQIEQQFSPTAKRQIIQTERGFFAADPQTGESIPVTTTPREDRLIGGATRDGEQLKPDILRPARKAPLVQVKTGELETQFQKERGKGKAGKLQEIFDAGDRATAFDLNLDQIEQALDQGAFVGPASSKVATLNEISASLGLPADLESAANTRKIQQRVGDLTLQATGKLKGAISEKELKLAERTVFDLGTSELATRKAIDTLRTLTSYDQQLADLSSQLESEGRFTTDFRKEKKAFDKNFRKNLLDQINTPLPEIKTQEEVTTGTGIKFIGFE